MGLSVIVITKDAQRKMQACLAAVQPIADEIIVVDSGSTDDTLAICRRFTDKVYERDWPGYGIQKQRALDLATQEWVLSLDADEVLEQELAEAIKKIVETGGDHNAYMMVRRMYFLGKLMKHAGCDQPLRFFRRNKACFSQQKVHEFVITEEAIGMLPGYCLHYSYGSLEDWLTKMNLYTSLEAQDRKNIRSWSGVTKAVLSSIVRFIRCYFFKKYCLDGKQGFVYTLGLSMTTLYLYLKVAFDDDDLSKPKVSLDDS